MLDTTHLAYDTLQCGKETRGSFLGVILIISGDLDYPDGLKDVYSVLQRPYASSQVGATCSYGHRAEQLTNRYLSESSGRSRQGLEVRAFEVLDYCEPEFDRKPEVKGISGPYL